ncbi:hypothetical protein KAI87_04600 [Myxococcota bacterium]|nr:hypothetical protein [Myxococcota bacterium]
MTRAVILPGIRPMPLQNALRELNKDDEKGILTAADFPGESPEKIDQRLETYQRVSKMNWWIHHYFDYSSPKSLLAIELLKSNKGEVSAADLSEALIDGTRENKNPRVTERELKDFQNYAHKNWDKLSIDAKATFRVYERSAMAAAAQSEPLKHSDLKASTEGLHYRDESAMEAIVKLKNEATPISKDRFIEAILRGTEDDDKMGATTEFEDFRDYSKANWDALSPEAQKVYSVYERYASVALAMGKSGINLRAMTKEMRAIS